MLQQWQHSLVNKVAAINAPAHIPAAPQQSAQPRAKGAVQLSSKLLGTRSVLDGLRQSGSLKLLFPRPSGTELQAVTVNTAGGVTGGDHFELSAKAAPETTLTLTTQAAERAYRAQIGECGTIRNHLEIGENARLNWLPQETILFQASALDRRLTVDMHSDARLLLCETLVFARTATGETLRRARLRDRITVNRGGHPLFVDALSLMGDIAAQLARPGVANGATCLCTLLYVAPDAEAHLAPIRAALGPTAGVSLLHPDVLVLRALAADSFLLRQTLIPVLTRLSGGDLPRPWMI